VQEAGWAKGTVWTSAENLAPTGIQSPDRPACSQSLYRLRYLAHVAGVLVPKELIKKKDTSPLQYLFEYFIQPFKDISCPYTSWKEINKIRNSLKNKNSSGYDEITTKIIKISIPFIISPIINICNKMLAQGIYPERLKFSLIKPIYKSGVNLLHLIIDPSPYCLHFQKFLKKSYTKDYLIILIIMLYWTNTNMDFEAQYQRKMLPIYY